MFFLDTKIDSFSKINDVRLTDSNRFFFFYFWYDSNEIYAQKNQ